MRNGMMTGMAVVLMPLLAGCGSSEDAGGRNDVANVVVTEAPVVTDPVAPTADPAPAEPVFAGTWTGPEGLSFVVERKADGGYRVRNRDTLDTEQTFDAVAEAGTLRFVRRSKAQAARPGTGVETGFKWLANKKDCLIVEAGVEGYCRD